MREDGLVSVQYPPETLHEIITNAVLHRDYALSDDVHVRIFDNRVEVESPGRLPAHITPENILRERFARNASIVRIINKFPNPPNKDVGEGLNTAFSAMAKLRLREPEIKEGDHSTLDLLPRRAPRLAGVPDPQVSGGPRRNQQLRCARRDEDRVRDQDAPRPSGHGHQRESWSGFPARSRRRRPTAARSARTSTTLSSRTRRGARRARPPARVHGRRAGGRRC